jgi:hypothetical protein
VTSPRETDEPEPVASPSYARKRVRRLKPRIHHKLVIGIGGLTILVAGAWMTAPRLSQQPQPKEADGLEKMQRRCCGRHPIVRYLEDLDGAILDKNMRTEVERCVIGAVDSAKSPTSVNLEACLRDRAKHEPAFVKRLSAQVDEASENVSQQVPSFNTCLMITQTTFAECGKCKCEGIAPGTGPSRYKTNRGQVVKFDGQTGYVHVPRTDALALEDKVTIEAWVRLTHWFHGNYFPIVDRGWRLEATPEGISFTAGYHHGTTLPVALQRNRWTHVAMTYSTHRKAVHWFIDGRMLEKKEYDQPFLETERENPEDLYIGYGPTGNDEFANGYFDEVRIWKVERTPEQIADSMNSSLPGDTPGLIGCWKFDELEGPLASSTGPLALTGTFVGSVVHVPAAETQ